MLTLAQIEKDLALAEKATKGPWHANCGDTENPPNTYWTVDDAKGNTIHDGSYSTKEANCVFTSRARTALPEYAKALMEAMEGLYAEHVYATGHQISNPQCKVCVKIAAYHAQEKPE